MQLKGYMRESKFFPFILYKMLHKKSVAFRKK